MKSRTRIMKYAIILAAGSGNRFGGKKQYEDLNGKPVYQFSLDAFSGMADEILMVVPDGDKPDVAVKTVVGGKERYDSVYAALCAISADDDDLVAIHDAARPGVTKDIIERTYKTAQQDGAAVAVTLVTDTIRTVDGELIDRNKLRAMQTPQTFRYGIIRKAYDKLYGSDEMNGITDDVEVVRRALNIKATMVEGDFRNMKITVRKDLDALLNQLTDF